MRKRKIIRALLLFALLASLLLGGCGKDGGQADTPASVSESAKGSTEKSTAEGSTAAEESTAEGTAATGESAVAETEPPVFTPEEGSLFAGLPSMEGGTWLESRDMGDGAELLVYESDSDALFEAYGAALAADGFTLYAENQIDNNLYATWTDEELTVSLIYLPDYDGTTRVVAEPKGPLPDLQPQEFEKVCEPAMAMVSADFDRKRRNGMCFVYRTSDGSFIIVDGGFNDKGCADAIYHTLTEMAPDPDHIVIAAWFITHAHGDHIGASFAFAENYGDQVTLESFIINFPSEDVFSSAEGNVKFVERHKANVLNYPDCQTVEAHPGQIFYIRDAVITMLYTWELYMANEQITWFNNTSLAFTIELGGSKIIQLGDCGPEESKILTQVYSDDTLDCDIAQVAHHGFLGTTVELNEKLTPDVVLWPTNQVNYKKSKDVPANAVFNGVENCFVAGQDVCMFELPFRADQVKIWPAFAVE